MILKNKKIWAGLIILATLVGGIMIRGNRPQIDKNLIQKSAFIPYPSQYNYRQTKNDCGPFNVAAMVSADYGNGTDWWRAYKAFNFVT